LTRGLKNRCNQASINYSHRDHGEGECAKITLTWNRYEGSKNTNAQTLALVKSDRGGASVVDGFVSGGLQGSVLV